MCEYCGCQAVSAIRTLTAEHDTVVALISRAVSALRAEGMSAAVPFVRQIVDVLGLHTAVEEQALFPALAADFGPHVARFVAEHRSLDETFEQLLDGDVVATSTAASTADEDEARRSRQLMSAFHLLREHILAEQDGAFPAALAALSPEQWQGVEDARRRFDPTRVPEATTRGTF